MTQESSSTTAANVSIYLSMLDTHFPHIISCALPLFFHVLVDMMFAKNNFSYLYLHSKSPVDTAYVAVEKTQSALWLRQLYLLEQYRRFDSVW